LKARPILPHIKSNVFYLLLPETLTTFNLGIPAVVTSNYSSALTNSSQTFTRYGGSGIFYYEVIEIIVTVTGNYSFTCYSPVDTYGYLYANSFDPSNVNVNLLVQDNDSGGDFQFYITILLQSGGTYILVVTTYAPGVTTTFSIITAGPASINLPNTTVMAGITSASSFQTTTTLPVYSSK
jgi:hypothetical protein